MSTNAPANVTVTIPAEDGGCTSTCFLMSHDEAAAILAMFALWVQPARVDRYTADDIVLANAMLPSNAG